MDGKKGIQGCLLFVSVYLAFERAVPMMDKGPSDPVSVGRLGNGLGNVSFPLRWRAAEKYWLCPRAE
ncbi:hypothetical protein SERLA73DRAFT_122045 [Serpula lacrymans var. lacrymans S7.3]|uniref:Uncharacterized protein n=1 Tax=Serpula lacrymans var. lacrymans (strain S7.3) TaxID=936435 RepID=F8PWD6_SERL3|nr:hypothetical protein SERLA73DRAFT_122045 [Serpula lacrymans var. lacrymans S7.3]